MAARRQPEIGADRPGAPEAGWVIDRGAERQGGDRPDPRHGHETAAVLVPSRQAQQLAIEVGDLSANFLAHRQKRSNGLLKVRILGDEFFGPAGEDVALRLADNQAEVLEQTADLVSQIALDSHQQGPTVQDRADLMTR